MYIWKYNLNKILSCMKAANQKDGGGKNPESKKELKSLKLNTNSSLFIP